MVILRFSASKVALVTGLHEFGNIMEEVLECVYQDREELLVSDAARLQLQLVSNDEKLELFVQKSGATGSTTSSSTSEAHKSKKLANDEAQEVRKLLAEKIHTSIGTRNELLALEAYERQTGSKVRHTNEHFYFLTFPSLPKTTSVEDAEEVPIDYSLLAEQCQRTTILRQQRLLESETMNLTTEDKKEERSTDDYFSICGMVDGIADVLTISADDEWGMMPVVVEIKNRMRGFRNPPPLYDHIQLDVYMKMLGVEHGDLVECIYGATSNPTIRVSRVSLGVAPLCLPMSSTGRGRDIWTEVIVPRLYAFTAAVQKLRSEELLRLAFLNGTEEERLAIVRVECDFL
ncbi:unnamed protein product [Peronospora destructor]|uniref:YqaJ viral recombinase domain-containing protein n=1 Tax=Peronospora destructor TaxID=86335 RepID=A0AAV0V9C4_9STRA|nr:unnamed protein product [Peronospora destructor]